MKPSFILFALLILHMAVTAQSVPAPKDVLGYEIGEHFTPHYKIVEYYRSLAKSSPSTMKLEQYGSTNAGKPLLLAFVSSAENIARLDAIRRNNLKLSGLEPGDGELNGIVMVWLSYNVHGNEASSSEASMKTIYHLLTDAASKEWLKNTVVIIDPCLNPDGRDRYVHWFNSVVGVHPNPDPQSREHQEPWPGGRSNYYNFDLNRDWAWQSQVESRARIKAYNFWMPQVHVDYHEQGYNEPYYFAPAAEPFHEVITPWQRDFQAMIGRNNAKYFDKNSWLYFTKERFDLFYPSYGDTWPTYNGSVGMTYEQGGHSRGGLAVITEDGDTLTLADRANHHFTTGLSTIETSSKNAVELQKNFKAFFDNNTKNGAGIFKTFVLKAKDNEEKIKNIRLLLEQNQIRYGFGNTGTAKGLHYSTGKEETFSIEPGDMIISTYQPEGSMAKVLFEPISRLVDSVTYDITAWAVPYAYGVEAYAVKERLPVTTTATAGNNVINTPVKSAYGYIKSWNNLADAKFLAACMQEGIKVRMTEKAFEVNGKKYTPGSLILIRTSNNAIRDFDEKLLSIAKEMGAELDAVQSGYMDKGADFGSPDVKTLTPPRVALLTGEGVSSLGAGEVWHYFEQQLHYPITLINTGQIGTINWNSFNVIIAPDGRYRNLFVKDGDLQNWIKQGGKLIALENAVNQLANMELGLVEKKEGSADKDKKDDYALLKKYGSSERDWIVNNNPGSIYKVDLDNTHPLAFGFPSYYYTLKSDDNIYEFLKDGWNVGVLKKNSQIAGFTGVKTLEKLQDGVLFGELPTGRGTAVFLTDDVLFRSFWENGKMMFANALFMVNQGKGFTL